MILYAKSALKKEQMDVKMDIGCDGLEIQLLGELVNGKLGDYRKAKDVFPLKELSHYPVKVVHCPLLSNFGISDVNIESFATKDFELLDQCCYIADYFGKRQFRTVIVVVHSEMSMENMNAVGILDKVVKTVNIMLTKYKHIEFAIENVTPLRKVYKGEIHLCNNYHFDNVELVKFLRKELQTDRIGTCLDTCHTMVAEKYIRRIFEILEDIPYEGYSLEDYFKANQEYIKLIHLSDAKGNGYGAGKHGIKFSKENEKKLKEIVGFYHKYQYHCPVTLEVEETDFSVCDGYQDTRNTLIEIL